MSMVDKNRFTNSGDYQAALDAEHYDGQAPVDDAQANLCLAEKIREFGPNCQDTVGECEVGACDYSSDKLLGMGGVCLVRTVGIAERTPEDAEFSSKYVY